VKNICHQLEMINGIEHVNRIYHEWKNF
jgi:hypothetical protein